MIRIPAARTTRVARAGAAAASVIGVVALAGCVGTGAPPRSGSTGDAASSGSYADGSYTAEGSYATPESVETISVTVSLQDDVITDVQVEGQPTRAESEQYQGQFIGGIRDVVVGKDIDEVSVSRVAGSSLTSGGFTQALDAIKAEASA